MTGQPIEKCSSVSDFDDFLQWYRLCRISCVVLNNLKPKKLICMTFVNYKNRPAGHVFNNSLNEFFPQFASLLKDEFRQTPVNIKETENSYVLEVVAPGFSKEDFKISLDKNILTVEGEKKTESNNENEKLIKKEYTVKSFKRSFTVDENIDADSISANFVNGILTLNLAKKAEVKPSVKNISVL